MRTKHTIMNSFVGIISQFVLALANVVLRRIFVDTIGLEYLGVSGLFGNILSFLALTESGVGVAMAYSLYQPLADHNQSKISALMNFYKKIYMGIAGVVCALGLTLIPLLPYLIKESSFSQNEILIFYLFFLGDNVCSYFWAYKTTFLNANQESYIVTVIRTTVYCVGIIIKGMVLMITQNFLLYLGVAIITTIMNNVFISWYVSRKYSFIQGKAEKPDEDDKRQLIKNVKGLIFHKIGAFAVFGTDNIIISMFINLKTAGIYSNYSLILSQLNSIAAQIFNALTPSMGNYIATSSEKRDVYNMYRNILCLNFLIYGYFVSVLACVIQPFVMWWIGKEGILTQAVVYLLLIDFYLKGMRNTTQIVKTAGGLFYEDRFSPVIEAVVNLVISIVLVNKIGIAGVFVGTILSGLVAPFWITPYYLYKDLLQVRFREYFKYMLSYFILLMFSVVAAQYVGKIICVSHPFLNLIIQVIVITLFDGVLFFLVLHKRSEFKFLINNVAKLIKQRNKSTRGKRYNV